MPQALRPSCSMHVPLVGVEQRGGDLAAVGAAADEGDRADLGRAHQHLGQLLAAAGDQRDGQAGAAHQRVREGEADRAALRRGLGDDRVAGQQLHQLGVHQHAHRVVPAGDVADRAGQRLAAGQPGGRSPRGTSARRRGARSTSAQASRHGLPISQTSSRASRSRCSVSASSAAATRALRSASGVARPLAVLGGGRGRTAAGAVVGVEPGQVGEHGAVDRGGQRGRAADGASRPRRGCAGPSPSKASGATSVARLNVVCQSVPKASCIFVTLQRPTCTSNRAFIYRDSRMASELQLSHRS